MMTHKKKVSGKMALSQRATVSLLHHRTHMMMHIAKWQDKIPLSQRQTVFMLHHRKRMEVKNALA